MRVGSKYLLSSRSWKKSKGRKLYRPSINIYFKVVSFDSTQDPIPRSMLSSGKRKPDMPIIIDLTSDDDDEQVTVTNLSQVLRPPNSKLASNNIRSVVGLLFKGETTTRWLF